MAMVRVAMASFVLIPGGWRGGWTFADFVARLKRAGHEAYAVTLSGLDEVPEPASANINLDTHTAGVADRAPERIAALAYLDAFVPADGQSWWDLANEHFRQLIIENARHDGLTVEPTAGGDVRRRPHPIGSFL